MIAWAHARSLPLRVVHRARIVTMAADGADRERFLALRVVGLKQDAPRPGRIPYIPANKVRAIMEATLHTKPPAATHWSTRTMADAHGVSEFTVRRIWKQHGLKPHLVRTFKISRDKQFIEKLYDVVGLYLDPPDRSLVLAVDEKSQVRALDRTQPGLLLKRGRCGNDTA